MAIASNRKDLSVEVIEEYLTAARACINTLKPNGGILGFPATLLLLCTVDAIGNGVLQPERRSTRLEVLKETPFNLNLNEDQVNNLADWYRHLLAHTATIAEDVSLTTEAQGEPFDFDMKQALTVIRVPVLHDVVKAAWERTDKSAFNPPPPRARRLPDPTAKRADFASTPTSSATLSKITTTIRK